MRVRDPVDGRGIRCKENWAGTFPAIKAALPGICNPGAPNVLVTGTGARAILFRAPLRDFVPSMV
jgi:hypothetical protein